MMTDDEIRAAHHAERDEIAFTIWKAHHPDRPGQTRALFDALNQPSGEHPKLRPAFDAADALLRSVALVKALFDTRLRDRVGAHRSTTGARIGISGLTDGELVHGLRYWGGEMDRSASELLSAGQLNAGGGSATVAALMTEAAARLEKSEAT